MTEDGTHNSSLEIDEVELSDTGEYTCNVSNPVGFVFRHNRLEVQGVGVVHMYTYCIFLAQLKTDADDQTTLIAVSAAVGAGLVAAGLAGLSALTYWLVKKKQHKHGLFHCSYSVAVT